MANRMEEIGKKGAGQLKGAIAALKGETGIFRTLVQQHGEVSVMLKRLKGTDDANKRLELWAELRSELLSHDRAETRVLYPELKNIEKTKLMAEQHDQEASQLEALIFKLDGIDTGSDEWPVQINALMDLVSHHIDEEEKEWFPEAMDALGKDRADELNDRFLAQKEAVVEELR
jgi:hemerythrin-like domain-containing protein